MISATEELILQPFAGPVSAVTAVLDTVTAVISSALGVKFCASAVDMRSGKRRKRGIIIFFLTIRV